MKRMVGLVCGIAMFHLAFAQTVYEGYPAYYRTLNGVFKKGRAYPFLGPENNAFFWQGQWIELSLVKAFPREDVDGDDLGTRALAYEQFPYACVEGQSSSSNGTAVRHKSVYLIEARTVGKTQVYKLSSLFASCTAVRLDEQKRPLFYDADFVYSTGSDSPTGLTLKEYVISQGEFEPTGHSVTTRFVEPDNVYKFEVVGER